MIFPRPENASLSGNVINDDDGNGIDSDPDGDALSVSAVNGITTNVGVDVSGLSGGTFNITSTGAYTFDPGTDFDYLAVSETATTSVTYTISDGEGGTDTATVIVTVTGTNDAPTAVGTIGPQAGVDSTTIAPLDVSGFFNDLDTNDSLSFTDGGTLPAGLMISSAGLITGTFDADASQGSPYSVVITATDGSGASVTQSFTWTVTNPAPTATDNDLATTENASLSGNVIADDDGNGIDSDPDGDSLSVSAVNGNTTNVGTDVSGSTGGTFNISAAGAYTFDPGSDFDYLAVSETATTSVTYTVSDGEGGTDSATVTVTVTGTNDAPTAVGTIGPQAGVDSTTIAPLDVSGFFDDLDTSDSLSFSAGGTLPAGLMISSAGVITGTFDADASQGSPYSVVITATDGSGASVTQSFTWTVTNPAPTATDNDLATTENVALSGNVITDDDGNSVDSDPDGDSLSVSAVNGNTTNVGVDVSGSTGGTFNISSTGAYTFDPGADFDYLAVSETAMTSVTYTGQRWRRWNGHSDGDRHGYRNERRTNRCWYDWATSGY